MDVQDESCRAQSTIHKRKRTVEQLPSKDSQESAWDSSSRITDDSCPDNCTGIRDCESIVQDLRQSDIDECSEAELQDLKRPKFIGLKVKGSVQYEDISPKLLNWPFNFSLRNVSNFRKSGPPSRMMFYDHGEWKDFSEAANTALCERFMMGPSAELSIGERKYFVNFFQMLQLNMVTGYLRSIAWIDVNGKCFFPYQCVEGIGNHLLSQFLDTSDNQLLLSEACANACLKSIDSYKDGLITLCPDSSNSPVEITPSEENSRLVTEEALEHHEPIQRTVSHDFTLLGDKIIKLNEADHGYNTVRSKFYLGLGMLAPYTTITGIYKDSHKSTSGQARLQAFKRQEEITRMARGNANVKYAWHGTSKHGVSGIVLHGFGQPRIPKNGAMYGVGVYLAPEDYSHVSAVYSDVDENGEQHMVLCRAIMGNMEQVPYGSEQFHPSSEEYDTGVDNLCTPKRYIIWSTHMSTHVLPEYIVSFKLASPWHGVIAALRGKHVNGKSFSMSRNPQSDGQVNTHKSHPSEKVSTQQTTQGSANCELKGGCSTRVPRSPWMSFPMLFLVMNTKLAPEKMHELQQHYLQFKAGRMPREQLIKVVRHIAGDRLLADSIRSMQAQEKANIGVSNITKSLFAGEQKNDSE